MVFASDGSFRTAPTRPVRSINQSTKKSISYHHLLNQSINQSIEDDNLDPVPSLLQIFSSIDWLIDWSAKAVKHHKKAFGSIPELIPYRIRRNFSTEKGHFYYVLLRPKPMYFCKPAQRRFYLLPLSGSGGHSDLIFENPVRMEEQICVRPMAR